MIVTPSFGPVQPMAESLFFGVESHKVAGFRRFAPPMFGGQTGDSREPKILSIGK
jgi:hypothetical protein